MVPGERPWRGAVQSLSINRRASPGVSAGLPLVDGGFSLHLEEKPTKLLPSTAGAASWIVAPLGSFSAEKVVSGTCHYLRFVGWGAERPPNPVQLAAAGGVATGEADVAASVTHGHVAAVGASRGIAHVLLQRQIGCVRLGRRSHD